MSAEVAATKSNQLRVSSHVNFSRRDGQKLTPNGLEDMQTVDLSIKLTPEQARRLNELAEQCSTTPAKMAAMLATLALTKRLREIPIASSRSLDVPDQVPPKRPGPALSQSASLPDSGFLRLREIIGQPAKPGEPAPPRLVPVSRSTWLAGVKSGRFPRPVKLGPATTAWRAEDIRALIQRLGK